MENGHVILDYGVIDSGEKLIAYADLTHSKDRKDGYDHVVWVADFRDWVEEKNLPVCESFDEYSEFCKNALKTEAQRQTFAELNLHCGIEGIKGDLEDAYQAAVKAAWQEHYDNGVRAAVDEWWDVFVEDVADKLITDLVATANENGYKITKHDLIEMGINNQFFGDFIKDDAPAPQKAGKERE